MEHISSAIRSEDPSKPYISFEFFPPRESEHELIDTRMPLFVQQGPVFLDVTWGAGGSTSEKTMHICSTLHKNYPNLPVNMHLTCTNMPKGLLFEALEFAKTNGIRNVVALRGDPPAGQEFHAVEDGFGSAVDLVKYIRATYGDFFCITVSGYPEGHPSKLDSDGRISEEDFAAELAYLKTKVDAGADLIITQLFYDAKLFIRFVKRCREIGITIPILPGILPFNGYKSLMRMVSLCKTYLPADVKAKLEELKDDSKAFAAYGVDLTVSMIKEIQEADIGVNHFHFYTVNCTEQTFAVLKQLGWFKE
eukprot:gene6651-4768_t